MQSIAVVLLMVLPWLDPFAPGPSPAVGPWLISLAMTGLLFFIWPLRARWTPERVSPSPPDQPGISHAMQNHTRAIAVAWVMASVLSSVIGLVQYSGAASQFAPWVSQTQLGEAFANLRQRNQFATLTNIGLPALIWLATQYGAGSQTARSKYLLVFGAILLAAANAASSSRTGLVQLVLLCAVYGFWYGRRQPEVWRLLVVAVGAYVLATLALPWSIGLDASLHGIFARLKVGDIPCSSRTTLWLNILQLIAQKPWLGWGWGEVGYAHFVTLYDGPRFCDLLDNAHNLPLHLAVELGIPFALLICISLGWCVARLKPWKEHDATRQLAWAVLALILLHSLLEYPLWYGPFQMAVGLAIVLLWKRPKKKPHLWVDEKNESKVVAVPVVWMFIAIFLIATCAYAAWDYHRVSQIYLVPSARDPAYREDTLEKIRGSRLFRNQVRFAELGLTPLTRDNAQWTFDTSTALLHYSPEPRVIEKVIESATLLGRDDEALAYLARYKIAYPAEHSRWLKLQTSGAPS